jgi:hypothetical protein
MSSIGSLALALSVNPTEFVKGLEQAATKLQGFANQAKSALSSIPFFGGAGGLLPGASVGGITSFLQGGMDSIVETAKASDRLGISMKQMVGIQEVAKARSEDLAHAIGHLSVEVGAARSGSEEARKKFAALGITMGELSGRNAAADFGIVSDALKGLGDRASQAHAAHEIFGKAAIGNLDLLTKGHAAYEQAAANSSRVKDRFGVEEALKAQRAIKDLEKSLKALGEQAALGLAPLLARLAEIVTNLVKARELMGHFNILGAMLTRNPDEPFTEAGRKARAQAQGTDAAGMKQDHDFLKMADDIEKALQQQRAGLGLSANMHEVLKAAVLADTDSQKGYVEWLKKKADALDKDIAALQRENAMMEQAQKVMEENIGPLQKFQIEMQRLAEWEKIDAISKDDRMKASKGLADKLRDSLGLGNAPGVVSAAEAGSTQAQQIIAQKEARDSMPWVNDLKQLMKEGNNQNDKMIELLKEWLEANREVIQASF